MCSGYGVPPGRRSPRCAWGWGVAWDAGLPHKTLLEPPNAGTAEPFRVSPPEAVAYSLELLQAVAALDEATLQQGLRHLVEAELVYQRGLPPQATYMFKHALIQDAAYQSLLRRTRQQYHQRIAQVLAAQFPETVETQPELLAHHYTEAGLSPQAISYWQRAGERAIQYSAHVEAISHLTKGLEVLKTLVDSPERFQHELAIQTSLGLALIATKGYAAPEVEKAYARARELCRQMGETPWLFPVLRGLWLFHFVGAELHIAYELGEQLLTLGQSEEDPAFLLEAHRAMGTTLFWLGQFPQARAHLEQGIDLYDPQQSRSLIALYGQDPRVTCLGYTAWVLWVLGYPDQAMKKSHEALALAQELSHPFSLAFALVWTAQVRRFRRDGQATQELAEAVIALSHEQGFTQRLAEAMIQRGWALAEQGQREEGSTQIRQGLAAFRATGANVGLPHNLAMLAETRVKGKQIDEGLSVLAEALAIANSGGVHWYEPELYRLKGESLLEFSAEQHAAAEACFRQALDIARQKQAKSCELRAAMSLARLWQQQGKRAEACELLAPVYGWFTEGFDTADLQDAKALLEALGA